jgi:hypothetical protein
MRLHVFWKQKFGPFHVKFAIGLLAESKAIRAGSALMHTEFPWYVNRR